MTKANKLSMFRLALIPLYVLFLFKPISSFTIFSFEVNNIVAFLFFILILLTDYLDGVVARKYNQITLAGKLIDPTIDKIVTLIGFSFFVKYYNLDDVSYYIIIFREILILGFRLLLVSSKAPAEAKMLGKIKTATSFVLLCFLTINPQLLVINGVNYNNFIFVFVSFLTFISGLDYVIKSWKVVKKHF